MWYTTTRVTATDAAADTVTTLLTAGAAVTVVVTDGAATTAAQQVGVTPCAEVELGSGIADFMGIESFIDGRRRHLGRLVVRVMSDGRTGG